MNGRRKARIEERRREGRMNHRTKRKKEETEGWRIEEWREREGQKDEEEE